MQQQAQLSEIAKIQSWIEMLSPVYHLFHLCLEKDPIVMKLQLKRLKLISIYVQPSPCPQHPSTS